jgi:hypothetical protein
MFARALVAKFLVMFGLAFVKAAIVVGGGGKADVDVAVCPMEFEPFWMIIYSVIFLPIFWFSICIFFAATGDM